MDKRVIFAVAGSGKTTYIVDSLSVDKRSLIVTYTNSNFENLLMKISKKFGGIWPEHVTLMTYFQFLYRFCYSPFLADRVKAKGIVFDEKLIFKYAQKNTEKFYITSDGYFHSCRLALFLETNLSVVIKERIEKYFDEFIIDEVQDIAGRDFNFLETLMDANINMLFVGDFYQHTFDTSRDGNVNKSLFVDRMAYETRFAKKGFITDTKTLVSSWRCGKKICDYITKHLGIKISSNRNENDNTDIIFVSNSEDIKNILEDQTIVKLHYRNSNNFGVGHRNWGETKGEDKYLHVCVMLNKKTAMLHNKMKLCDLAPSTRNKLYVAITRAHGNVYLVYE